MAAEVQVSMEGSVQVFADKVPTLVSTLDAAAKQLAVSYELGPERTVASRGLLCRRYVSLMSIRVEGPEESARLFTQIVGLVARDICR